MLLGKPNISSYAAYWPIQARFTEDWADSVSFYLFSEDHPNDEFRFKDYYPNRALLIQQWLSEVEIKPEVHTTPKSL